MTIGQAFELAYKKYLDTNGKELETQKQLLTLQKRIELLENENSQLKSRLRDISKIKGEQDIQDYLTTNKVQILSLNILQKLSVHSKYPGIVIIISFPNNFS